MPCWHANMTDEDHAKNRKEAARQARYEAQTARSMAAQWEREAERLEGLAQAYDKPMFIDTLKERD